MQYIVITIAMKTKNKKSSKTVFFKTQTAQRQFIYLFCTGLRIQFLVLAYIGRASFCHTERRKTVREMNGLVCHIGLQPIATTAKKHGLLLESRCMGLA
jgi:hypothetical protein